MNISASSFACGREEPMLVFFRSRSSFFFMYLPVFFLMHFIKKFIPHSCVVSTCLPMELHFPVL